MQSERIQIIGDSLAAGAGSSQSYLTDEVILTDEGRKFMRRAAPNSWWGLLETYLNRKGLSCQIHNQGCGGVFSYQIDRNLDQLVSEEARTVIILMGVNDRKRENGREELKASCSHVVDRLRSRGKTVILCTPTPSVKENEYGPNRLFHTEEVVRILREIAAQKQVKLVDHYQYVCDYMKEKQIDIEDMMVGEGCRNDGLHPPDLVQRLMFENIVAELGL